MISKLAMIAAASACCAATFAAPAHAPGAHQAATVSDPYRFCTAHGRHHCFGSRDLASHTPIVDVRSGRVIRVVVVSGCTVNDLRCVIFEARADHAKCWRASGNDSHMEWFACRDSRGLLNSGTIWTNVTDGNYSPNFCIRNRKVSHDAGHSMVACSHNRLGKRVTFTSKARPESGCLIQLKYYAA
jgi:hypothetical protein